LAETHLVTGATGFVGSALVLELLRTTDVKVVCLVRPPEDARAAQQRLEQVLQGVAGAFNMSEVSGLIPQRCRAVPGDLCLDRCGIAPGLVGRAGEVWHSAASLRFEEVHRDEIFAQNVDGTRRALALGHAVGARKFNYISTAYVAGSRSGLIREELAHPDTPVNNMYESSKVQGEQLVAESGLDYRILRPSIVVGHSKTSAVINASGFYAYVRKLAHLRKTLERRGALRSAAELEVEGDPEAPLNLIPVDAVVSAAVRISGSRSSARVFHLTNAEPPSLGHAYAQVIAVLGMLGPGMTPVLRSRSPFTQQLARQMRFFVSYLTGRKEFERRNTDAVIGPEASRWPMWEEGLRRYVRWYLEHRLNMESRRSPARESPGRSSEGCEGSSGGGSEGCGEQGWP
jgi:nucleoside-diphosphate-sugar epimerase